MRIKKGLEIHSSDFWYDLTYGGYLRPTEICANIEDGIRVEHAIELIKDFEESCEEQIKDFID